MQITTSKGEHECGTIEAAARWMVDVQPSFATVDGHDIDGDGVDTWTMDSAVERIAAAMADGDWYWQDGSAYCPACMQCDSPAIDADSVNVMRGSAVSRCTCCGVDYSDG